LIRRALKNLPLLMLLVAAPGLAMDDMGEGGWHLAETVEVVGHSPHAAVDLSAHGNIDAFGFRPRGGDVYCFSMKFWMADGRRTFIENRRLRQDDVAEFDVTGTNRVVDRVEFNCHPSMGITGLGLEVVVR
jgi:hypothetical protein